MNMLANVQTPSLIHALVIKKADESRATVPVLADDAELFFETKPDTYYIVDLWMIYKAASTEKIKYGWNLPANATLQYIPSDWASTGTSILGTTNPKLVLGNNDERNQMNKYLIFSGDGGKMAVNWAQQVSGAGTAEVHKGSYLLALQEQ